MACSGAPATPPPAPQVDDEALTPPPANQGFQLAFGPFDVAAGGEVQLCRTMKLPNTEPIAVNELDVKLNVGSHHLILFRAHRDPVTQKQVTFDDQIFPCWGTVNFDDWEFIMDVNKVGGNNWKLGEGQAFVFQPGEQIMIQSHFVNAKTVQSPQGGMAYVNLWKSATPADQVPHPLHGMFTVDTRVAIPPGAQGWETDRMCTFSRNAQVVAMTGHFHARGTNFQVWQEQDITGDARHLVYNSDSWDSPNFQTYPSADINNGQPLMVNADAQQGFHFYCTYDNDCVNHSSTCMDTVGFGGHADVQEHCNLFFQYYYFDNEGLGSPLRCNQGSGGW
jgi:hypothetical protein